MERRHTISVPLVIVAALLAGMATVIVWLAFPGKGHSSALGGSASGTILRLAEDSWNGGEMSTNSDVPQVFYNNKVNTPKDYKSLLVTFSATSDQHNEGRLGITCLANSSPCDSYLSNEDDNPGSVVIGYHGGIDWHDNAVSQSWCVSNPLGKQQRILLEIDNSYGVEVGIDEAADVFFEHGNVTIDAVNLSGCAAGGFFFFEEELGPLAPTHR